MIINKAKVTIIINCFNGKKYLKEPLMSSLNNELARDFTSLNSLMA